MSAERHPFDPSDEDSSTSKTHDPEPQDQGMVVKAHCDCSSCKHWINGADWCPETDLKFDYGKTKSPHAKILQPLLRSEKHPGNKPKINVYNPKCLTKIERETIFKTLVHGETIPQPVEMFTETYFSQDIRRSLETLNYRYSLPIQSFAWPAIFRQMNVFMIGGPRTGKTIAYLPAVCTFCAANEDKYKELAKHKGPLVIIICPNSKQCEEIYDLIRKFHSNMREKIKVSIVTYPVSNLHYTDILITIPDSLIHCLKTRMFNLKRLCHLVLEDTSALLKNYGETMYKILGVVDEMLEHRPKSTKVQLIATSDKWTTDLKKLLESVYSTPLVCVENYLEAALYGNIHFEIKFLMTRQKMAYLEGVLRNKYRFYRTIVICDQDEIGEVNKFLVGKGIETIALSDDSSKEDIERYEVKWSFMQGGENNVLLCTDFVFDSLLCVTDAMWLINYSFSSSWTRFTKRFSALSMHYKSPLDSNEDGIRCKSLVMIDETCEKQMPKVLNLLGRLTKDLPPNYQTYADGFRTKIETEIIENMMEKKKKIEKKEKIDLCETLKLFGKCSNSLCKKRHLVKEGLDTSDDLPKSGKVRFKILNMKDVTQCTVQLIDHVDLEGRVNKFSDADLRKPLIYDQNVEKKQAEDVEVGRFYAHCDHTVEGEVYSLCHVLSVKDDTNKDKVEVKLTTELTLQTFKKKLFEVPANLKIVDVYFCNLIPPFRDEHFSGRSFHVVHSSLENREYKKLLLTGTIYLELDRTLWLDDVGQIFNVNGTDVVKFNLTKHLINLQVVEPCKNQVAALHKLCTKCNIVLPTYVRQIAKKAVKTKESEPQRAFLDDNVNEVFLSSAISPEEFYVRLVKFHRVLSDLEKDIQTYIKTEFPDNNLQVEIGKYYLALDPRGETYARAKILNVENNKTLVFYVDYGDEAIVDISTIKFLPTRFLTRLPFQAIQCRLYGLCPSFGEWDDEATDVLYKYLLEPDSDVFRSLFITVEAKDASDTVRSKVKYSVLLKDGYGEKNVLINQLLLDCGYATSIFDKIYDFEIPRRQEVEDSGSDVDDVVEEEVERAPEDIGDFVEDDFDLEVQDPEELLTMLGFPDVRKKQPRPSIPAVENNTNQSAIEARAQSETPTNKTPSYLTPEVYWSQTENHVRLKIKLIGVQQYKVSLVQKKILTFSTTLEDRKYALKLVLHKPGEIERHFASGQEVRVVLNKMEAAEWGQLTATAKRLRYVHYEIPDAQLTEVKRRILQLDITDDESDNDEEGPMWHQFSDLDSDFDHELDSSDLD